MSASVSKVRILKGTDFYTTEVTVDGDTPNEVARAEVTLALGRNKPTPSSNPIQCYETSSTSNLFINPSITFSSNAVGITYSVSVVLFTDASVIVNTWTGNVTVEQA